MKDDINFHIFIVEDDIDDQQIFIEAINSLQKNIKLTIFENGIDLLKILNDEKHQQPNVIFLDLFMPKLNGKETLLSIRRQNNLDTIPVVIFSNVYDIDYISDLFDIGANRYLHKPDSFNTLVNALNRTIESIKNNTLGGTAIINYVD